MDKRAWSLVVAVWLVVGVAHAQVTAAEKAAAEALFDQGLALMREGKLAEACTRLEQSQAIEHGIGTMLYLAECYERTGRTASAWALFREATSEAQAAGQAERAAAGRQRAERLEPTLSRLTVEVPEAHRVPGLEVLRDGAQLPQGLWGLALPVDPGEHRIEARALGHQPYAQTLSVGQGPGSWKLELPQLVAAPVAVAESTPAAPPPLASPTSPEPPAASAPASAAESSPRVDRSRPWHKRLALTSMLTGGALIAVAGGLGIRAIRKNNEAKADENGCNDQECRTPAGVDLTNQARTAATVSTIGWAVGGTLVAAGLLTYLIAPDSERQVGLSLDQHRATLHFGGAF